jgi:hypothetical protein
MSSRSGVADRRWAAGPTRLTTARPAWF